MRWPCRSEDSFQLVVGQTHRVPEAIPARIPVEVHSELQSHRSNTQARSVVGSATQRFPLPGVNRKALGQDLTQLLFTGVRSIAAARRSAIPDLRRVAPFCIKIFPDRRER